jgi:hypothetical protein
MKPDPLLDAVFSPGEESLRPVLKAARRRRVRRVIFRAGSIAACTAAAVWLSISNFSTPTISPHLGSPPSPQDAARQLAAGSFPKIETVSTRPLADSDIVHTTRDSVLVISTPNLSSAPATVADSELLASFEPGRAALVGQGDERRLVEY